MKELRERQQALLDRLFKIGLQPSTSEIEAESHRFLILMGLSMGIGGLIWGSLCLLNDLVYCSLIPFGYSVCTIINFWYFAVSKDFRKVSFIQNLFSISLPFLFQWLLGGFAASGAIMIWSLIALTAILTFDRLRNARWWTVLYTVLVWASFLGDSYFQAHQKIFPSPFLKAFFFGMNLGLVSMTIYLLFFYFVHKLKKQKFALMRLNNHLRSTEEELRQNSEELAAMNDSLSQTQEELQKSLSLEKQHKYQLQKSNRTLKRTQERLVQSEKMSSLGEMTAGIAHEINNPLNFITGGAQSLQMVIADMLEINKKYRELAHMVSAKEHPQQLLREVRELEEALDSDMLKEDADMLLIDVLNGAERVTKIVRGLEFFSRVDHGEINLSNVHDGLDTALTMLGHRLHNIEVVKLYDHNIHQIECFPSELNQVFVQLLQNAIDAIPFEGMITIGTYNLGETISITIQDNGVGIPQDIQRKIFDPFFTTKTVGEGEGLGLSMCYGIIKKHHGDISIESDEGQGAAITLTLQKSIASLIGMPT